LLKTYKSKKNYLTFALKYNQS